MRILDLSHRCFPCPALNLRHQECLFAIAPLRECFSKVHLIATLVIVPLVVQKIDARVEGFVCKLGCEEC